MECLPKMKFPCSNTRKYQPELANVDSYDGNSGYGYPCLDRLFSWFTTTTFCLRTNRNSKWLDSTATSICISLTNDDTHFFLSRFYSANVDRQISFLDRVTIVCEPNCPSSSLCGPRKSWSIPRNCQPLFSVHWSLTRMYCCDIQCTIQSAIRLPCNQEGETVCVH